jgi:hypothetical protein
VLYQTAAENRRARAIGGITPPILGDMTGKAVSQFGVLWRIPEFLRELDRAGGIDLPASNGEDGWILRIPAGLIIGRNGIGGHSEVAPDQTRRSDPCDILLVSH